MPWRPPNGYDCTVKAFMSMNSVPTDSTTWGSKAFFKKSQKVPKSKTRTCQVPSTLLTHGNEETCKRILLGPVCESFRGGDLSVCASGCPQGSWNQSPMGTEGGRHFLPFLAGRMARLRKLRDKSQDIILDFPSYPLAPLSTMGFST